MDHSCNVLITVSDNSEILTSKKFCSMCPTYTPSLPRKTVIGRKMSTRLEPDANSLGFAVFGATKMSEPQPVVLRHVDC